MLERVFQTVLITSCIGTMLGLIILALKPITKKRFTGAWNYYIWLAALLIMIFPIRLDLSSLREDSAVMGAVSLLAKGTDVDIVLEQASQWEAKFTEHDETKQESKTIQTDEKGRRIVSPALQEQRMKELAREQFSQKIAPGWAIVAVVILMLRLAVYGIFRIRIARTTRIISCESIRTYTKRKVIVRTADWITSPLLMGVFRPVLLMPGWEMSKEQVDSVLAHEMTHLRRNDMLYRWFVVLVKCVHWFNPMVYVISKKVSQECEITCDLAATESMDKEQRMHYVETILALFVEHRNRDYALTMGMAGTKSLLKKRFASMKNRKRVSKSMRLTAVVGAGALFVIALIFSGGVAAEAMPSVQVESHGGISNCEKCAISVLNNNCMVVKEIQNIDSVAYYVYGYQCPKCGLEWRGREVIESAYITKLTGKTFRTVSVDELLGVIDSEAERALEEQGIRLPEGETDTEEILKIIRKAIEASK